jgi:hypoxanthine phosphoribosyltransferase
MEFEAMVMITRGGIIPGGLLAEAMGLSAILTAAVDFPAEMESKRAGLFAWPHFIQFPEDAQLRGKRCLLVDDVWGSGRTATAVKNRISAAGGFSWTCVLHFNPYRNLFGTAPRLLCGGHDAHIVYPWEIDRGNEMVLRG